MTGRHERGGEFGEKMGEDDGGGGRCNASCGHACEPRVQ